MKRIFLTAAGLLALCSLFAQQSQDTTGFARRKLKVDEINLVSSYYHQEGNNAAVTGGIGSQKLTDFATVLELRLIKYDKKNRKQGYSAEMGIDTYTSASSDKIDLQANSSASYSDTRLYPSVGWTIENETKGRGFGAGLSLSSEFDYLSYGGNISFSKKTRNRSGEFTAKLQVYLDQVSMIAPVELRPLPGPSTESRNTFAGSFSYSQIINERLQVVFLADLVKQGGFLSLPFYRVYFDDGSVHQEKLPDNRLKLPLGVRANYFAGDRIIIKTYYRFYTDDWGIRSHTAELELPIKITPFVSISPFYRFYIQTAIKYFAPFEVHTAADKYYSSNYDLSNFNSQFFGAGLRLAPPKGVFGLRHFNALELRYGHYFKNIDMSADIISLNLKFK